MSRPVARDKVEHSKRIILLLPLLDHAPDCIMLHHYARVANAERDKEERARAREADRADRERRREEERGEKEKLRLLALAERDRQKEAAKMAAKYPIDDAAVSAFLLVMSQPCMLLVGRQVLPVVDRFYDALPSHMMQQMQSQLVTLRQQAQDSYHGCGTVSCLGQASMVEAHCTSSPVNNYWEGARKS